MSTVNKQILLSKPKGATSFYAAFIRTQTDGKNSSRSACVSRRGTRIAEQGLVGDGIVYLDSRIESFKVISDGEIITDRMRSHQRSVGNLPGNTFSS